MIEKSVFRDLAAEAKANKDRKPTKPRRGSRFERHRVARLMAVQATYEANHNDTPYQRTTKSFLEHRFPNHDHPVNPDRELFLHVMKALDSRLEQVQDILESALVGSWSIEALDSVLKSILMAGISELLTPYKDANPGIVIAEYVEITKGFLTDKEAGYVNKVLDGVVKSLST